MDKFLLPQAQPFHFEGGEHGVLLLHGFTGSPAHLRLIGEDLAAAGFSVRCIRLPGHGTKPEDMKDVTWQDWLLAARSAAREMMEKYRYFSVAGLSMGGVLSLMIAQHMKVTACVPIAAPVRIHTPFIRLARLAAPFYPMMKWRKNENEEENPYHIAYDGFPTKSAYDLSVLMDKAEKDLPLIDCPLLCIQSKADKMVKPVSPQMILDGVKSQRKGMLWLEKAPHVCTITEEKDKIVAAMIEFLRKAEETD